MQITLLFKILDFIDVCGIFFIRAHQGALALYLEVSSEKIVVHL